MAVVRVSNEKKRTEKNKARNKRIRFILCIWGGIKFTCSQREQPEQDVLSLWEPMGSYSSGEQEVEVPLGQEEQSWFSAGNGV